MKVVELRPPIFVADLAEALEVEKLEIHRQLIGVEVFVIGPGLIEDTLAVEVARRMNRKLVLLEPDPDQVNHARDLQRRAMEEFSRRGKRGDSAEEP